MSIDMIARGIAAKAAAIGAATAEQFGAIGDGVHDDTAAIAAALAAGDVGLLAKTYLVSSVVVPNGRALVGQGRGQTTIKAAAGSSTPTVSVDSTAQNCTVGGFTIDGNKAKQTSAIHGFAINSVGPWPTSGTNYPGASHNIFDLYAVNCKGDGINIAAGGGGTSYRKLYAYQCDGRGMYVNVQDSNFHDLNIGASGLHGLEIGTGGYNCRYTNVKVWYSGQLDKVASGDGIYCQGWYNNIVGFEVQDAGRNGVYLEAASHNVLLGHIESPGSPTNPSSGIVLHDSRYNLCDLEIFDRDATPSLQYGAMFKSGGSGASFNTLHLHVSNQTTGLVSFDDATFQPARNNVTVNNSTTDDGWNDLSRRLYLYQQIFRGPLIVDTGTSVTATKFAARTNGDDSASIGFANSRALFWSGSHGSNPGWAKIGFGDGVDNAKFQVENYNGSTFQRLIEAQVSAGAPKLAFFGATLAAKPTVTGSRGGNAALASLITALATLGLLTDSSTA